MNNTQVDRPLHSSVHMLFLYSLIYNVNLLINLFIYNFITSNYYTPDTSK